MKRYSLQQKQPYPFKVRHELRKNMTNLPERWTEVALSDSIEALEDVASKGDRIIERIGLKVIKYA